jgi:hypothetical protein
MPYYYQATNWGKGFITHADNESAHIAGYPADIWVTENTAWAARVSATEKTQAEAQALVDAVVAQAQANWTAESGQSYPQPIVLP